MKRADDKLEDQGLTFQTTIIHVSSSNQYEASFTYRGVKHEAGTFNTPEIAQVAVLIALRSYFRTLS